jgi:AraC-like DNA-binding protein
VDGRLARIYCYGARKVALAEQDWAAMRGVINEVRQSLPREALRPFIVRYAGYRMSGLPEGVHIGLPSGCVRLIISLSRPIEVLQMPNTAQRPFVSRALVSGLQDHPAIVRRNVEEFGVSILVKPLGAQAIFGIPSAEISSLSFSLNELWKDKSEDLITELVTAKCWEARFAILDRTFLSRLTPVTPPSEISWSWQRLIQTHGTVSVARLADEVGYSRRYFGRQFRNQIGISPKSAARLIRFEYASGLIAGRGMSLAEVAMACSYFDQAHFTRDWHSLAGCTPRTWITREVPFLQDEKVSTGDNDLQE